MNKQDIYSIISNTCGVNPSDIQADSDFYDDLNCERTDLVELKLQVADLLKDEIPDEEFFACQTVNDLLELIESYSDELLDWLPKKLKLPIQKS